MKVFNMEDDFIIKHGEKHPYQPKSEDDADRFTSAATEDHGGFWTWVHEDNSIAVYVYFPKDGE